RQQRVFLPLDVAPPATLQPGIFALANPIQGLTQMAHDMELVEQNRRLWRIGIRRQTKWLPHVHHHQANARALPLAEPVVKLAHARLRTVLVAKPDRATAHEIADHDPVAVTFADRKLVDADHLRSGRANTLELRFHVLLVQNLDSLPVQRQFLRHVLDRCLPAMSANKVSKAFGVERIVGQKGGPFALHLATAAAVDPPYLQFQKYPSVATRKIAHAADLPVVPAHLDVTATAAGRLFDRRLSVITRAFGSPKIPRTVGCGRNPGNEYASRSRRLRFAVRA